MLGKPAWDGVVWTVQGRCERVVGAGPVAWLTSIVSLSRRISFLLSSILLRSTVSGINAVAGLFILLGFLQLMEFNLLTGWQKYLSKVNGAGAHRGC